MSGAKVGARSRRKVSKPRVIDSDQRDLLQYRIPGNDALDMLLKVTDLDNTLWNILWRLALDGPVVLSEQERQFIGPIYDREGQLRPWSRLVDILADACNDPEVKADDEVYKLADVFFKLARLAEMAGTSRVVGRALKLADTLKTSAAPTRVTGDDNRARVKAAWLADIAGSGPPRGRAGRVASRLRLPETTVKSVVKRLRELGQLAAD